VEPCRFFLEEWPGFARSGALRHYLHTAVEHEGSFERNKINDLAAEIEWHYNRVGATLPSFFQDTFAHDPASFNPMRTLTSSVAHADWWPLFGHLVFFLVAGVRSHDVEQQGKRVARSAGAMIQLSADTTDAEVLHGTRLRNGAIEVFVRAVVRQGEPGIPLLLSHVGQEQAFGAFEQLRIVAVARVR
jgi:hypothetical protein